MLFKNHLVLIVVNTVVFTFLSTSTKGQDEAFYDRLADSTLILTKNKVSYDPSYFKLEYPNGDVPPGKGVCSDVVIRAYRKLGIDLQKKIHEDMTSNFNAYPTYWGLKGPDKNIDHRRVRNLMVYFSRYAAILNISTNPKDYHPGDIVCWDLGEGVTHIGIVSNRRSKDGLRLLIVHNIGAGQVLEDMIFDFKIIGHYRFGI